MIKHGASQDKKNRRLSVVHLRHIDKWGCKTGQEPEKEKEKIREEGESRLMDFFFKYRNRKQIKKELKIKVWNLKSTIKLQSHD